MHGSPAPSAWVQRWAPLLPAGARVLDVACGSGRHLRWLAGLGHVLTGIDRDGAALQALHGLGELIIADLEAGPWPCPDRQFDAVIVTNYLWRPLFAALRQSLAPGGLLVYETFAAGNETVGRPSRPEFLLQPGELLERCSGLRIVAYEDGFIDAPPRFVQRVVARQPGGSGAPAGLTPLTPAASSPRGGAARLGRPGAG